MARPRVPAAAGDLGVKRRLLTIARFDAGAAVPVQDPVGGVGTERPPAGAGGIGCVATGQLLLDAEDTPRRSQAAELVAAAGRPSIDSARNADALGGSGGSGDGPRAAPSGSEWFRLRPDAPRIVHGPPSWTG